MARSPVLLAASAALIAVPAAWAQGVVFSLGQRDNSYAEFALAQEGHLALNTRFPGDIAVDGNAPDAAAQMPFLQPSTADNWAGSREHPIKITFSLAGEPSGAYRLTLDFVDVHWGGPPVLRADLNGHTEYAVLPLGAGNDASLKDPAAGQEVVRELVFPAKALRAGPNTLTLTGVGGSWVLYDAIILEHLTETPPARDDAVFRIGQHDNSYSEFALADRGHGAFPEAMPGEIVFDVAESKAGDAFPFIQPGPGDAWAGGKLHPITVVFNLAQEPAGDAELLIDLVAAHGGNPPLYEVDINGTKTQRQLQRGPGDDVLSDPAAGREQLVAVAFPGSCLQQGENRIALTGVAGSWVLYDALELFLLPGERRGPALREFAVMPQALRLRAPAGGERMARLTVDYWGPTTDGLLAVDVGGEVFTRDIPRITFGRNQYDVPLPALEQGPASLRLFVGDLKAEAQMELEPARELAIYVCPSIHTDIGYTHVQPECAQRHVESLLNVMRVCDETAGYPADAQMKWNAEVTWEVEQLLALAPEQAERFFELCRQGRMDVSAAYANMLSGLLSHEQLCRLTYLAQQLKREHEIPLQMATMTDVPSHAWGLPTILAGSGIRYFANGCNDCRGAFEAGNPVRPPVWWEGPDGQKVLYWFAAGYAHASALGLFDSLQAAEQAVPGFAGQFSTDRYPYDLALAFGAVGDNVLVTHEMAQKLCDVVRAWNEKYESPRLVLATNTEFFRTLEERYGPQLPTVRGDAGAYWEDGAGSSARETNLNRETHELLPTAEKLHSWLSVLDPQHVYPAEALGRALENAFLYDEHTWGAYCSISDPESQFTRDQWRIKGAFADDAHAAAVEAAAAGLTGLAQKVTGNATDTLLVVNPLSWSRAEVIVVPVGERPVKIVDLGTGADAVQELLETAAGRALALYAEGVPALGYKGYELRPLEAWPPAVQRSSPGRVATVETGRYRLRFAPQNGGLGSILDRETGRELVDRNSPYGVGQWVYDRGEPKLTFGSEQRGNVAFKRSRALGTEVELTQEARVLGSATMKLDLEPLGPATLTVQWSPLTPVLTFDLWTDKRQTYDPESVFVAFPFAVPEGRLRYELGDAVAEVNADQLPNGCRDWYSVQHFVDISNAEFGVTWCTRDAFLVEFCDIQTGNWLRELPVTNQTILANAMNNLWFTNYQAGQGGELHFRFAMAPHEGPYSREAATRFGFETANPLQTVVVPAGQKGALPAERSSFAEVEAGHAAILTVKQAETGPGLIIRLYETAGETHNCRLKLCRNIRRASTCTLAEEPLAPLESLGSRVTVPLVANGLATVRVELE